MTRPIQVEAHFASNHKLIRQPYTASGASMSLSSTDPWMARSRRRQNRNDKSANGDYNTITNKNPKQVLLAAAKSIQQDARGGAAAAGHIVKTMTARRMETFKFLSGGVAGTVAACVTNPLEVIKTQLQSSNRELQTGHPVAVAKTIIQQDGPSGFFRGLPPTLIGIIPSRSAYFYAYSRIKSFLHPTLPEGSPPNALIAGFLAGMVGNTLTNPIWMVRTRMQLLIDHTAGQRQYAGYGDAIATIWKEEGIKGFYKGITASYWGCAEGALQFILYEQLKTKLLDQQNERRAQQGLRPSQELPKATYFWSAAASKAVAAVLTYPHEVARTRMREQARSGIFKYKGMWQTLQLMAKEEGLPSLYSGMGVHLMKVVPNSALMFLTYEVVRGYLDQYKVVDP
ncbi:mitochondrial carrier protein [Nitzschia inconspicua]|uniref:Mitochondrial carrier protein n=1 Tax=Nitzschia inconspicua TaxID=303405 RepID=A0A9K3M3T2_9STRA|nr:mitochondrial carrier protein [Nitzschia inconspicua]